MGGIRKLRIQPQGRVDLLEIWHYLAPRSVESANQVTDAIEAAIRDLRDFPGKGHGRRDVRDQALRFWAVYSYVIAYRYDDDSLTVVRIVHGARDFKRVFRKRS